MLRPIESRALGLAASLALALALALPAAAQTSAAGGTEPQVEAANWTVFLSSGSSIAATEVHHDKNKDRYSLKLARGGYIHLSSSAVRRVSRETADRVEATSPMVATSTGSPGSGAVPGAVDTSRNRPPQMRSVSASVSPEGKDLKARTAERLKTGRIGSEGAAGRRPAGAGELTPQRGMMERMIKRTNSRATPSRR
jgi:hypothetical protein